MNRENKNYTYERTVTAIDELVRRYPFLRKGTIGKSVMGKDLLLLEIGEGETQVFYSGAFHANEGITTPLLLKFVEEYAYAVMTGGRLYGTEAAQLYKDVTLFVVPLVNPDGLDLVSGVLTSGSYYEGAAEIASSYPEIPFPAGWKANIEGIDLNLQFPAGWELAKEIKYEQGYTSPAPRDYVGGAPLVAPESRAVYEFTMQHSFSLILAYHTQGEVIYWKYKDLEPEHSREIAAYFGEVSGYAVEETPYASGNAGYKDWFILQFNRPGYTIEAGYGENPLPLLDFPQVYEPNTGILTGGISKTIQLLKEDV